MNAIGKRVYFYNPYNGSSEKQIVSGLCIDQDEKGYCVRFNSMSWWVDQVWIEKPK